MYMYICRCNHCARAIWRRERKLVQCSFTLAQQASSTAWGMQSKRIHVRLPNSHAHVRLPKFRGRRFAPSYDNWDYNLESPAPRCTFILSCILPPSLMARQIYAEFKFASVLTLHLVPPRCNSSRVEQIFGRRWCFGIVWSQLICTGIMGAIGWVVLGQVWDWWVPRCRLLPRRRAVWDPAWAGVHSLHVRGVVHGALVGVVGLGVVFEQVEGLSGRVTFLG